VKRVPFLNEKGVQVGEASVAHDGTEAEITVWADYDVLKRLEGHGISIGYTVVGDEQRDALSVQEVGK
jgi:hypothetical protein